MSICSSPDGGFRADGTFVSWPAHDTAPLTEAFRRAVLRLFVRRELFDAEQATGMLQWPHSGFHVHDAEQYPVWVDQDDHAFARRLARYCARNPVALERLTYDAAAKQVTYRSDKTERQRGARRWSRWSFWPGCCATSRTRGRSRRGIIAASHAVAPAAPTSKQPAQRSNVPGWPVLALSLWLVGVAAVFCRYAWSRLALHRLANSSTVIAGTDVLAHPILRSMGITRSVSFRSSGDVELPLTWGILRPQVVLPMDASEWTSDCRRYVLQHELAHIARLDAATQLVAQAASALFWFNPLVWYAAGQMQCERERACDDYVLASGAVASDYASDLLTLVTTHGYVERHSVAMAFARRSHFEGRLLALLDRTVERGVLSPRRVAMVLSLALAIAVPLAALSAGTRVVQRSAERLAEVATQLPSEATSSPAPQASVEPVAAPVASTTPIDRTAGAPLDHEDVIDPQAPVVHPVGAIAAKTTEPLGGLSGIHVLGNGAVVVNDAGSRRVLLFDSTLSTAKVLLDTGVAADRKYPSGPGPGGRLMAFGRDSTVIYDVAAVALVVLDPAGRIARVVAPPLPADAGYLVRPPGGQFDRAQRAIYQASASVDDRPSPMGNGPIPAADTSPIVRATAGRAAPETLAYVRSPKPPGRVSFVTKEGATVLRPIINPISIGDVWTLLPDGTVAILRGQDYHIDWVAPDGQRSASPKLPFQWHRLSDSDKVAIIDSVKQYNEAHLSRQSVTLNGTTVSVDFPAGVIPADSLADYRPPFAPRGAMLADADGNVWLLPTPEVPLSPNPGLVYDVVNRAGKLIDRVQLTPGFGIVGFSPGYVFMTIREGTTPVLVKAKIR